MSKEPKSQLVNRSHGGEGTEIGEIGKEHEGFETENDMGEWSWNAVELEAFMNEKLLIVVFDGLEEDLPIIGPEVNGIQQPIARNVPQWVRRKYVEALARSIRTGFHQKLRDPSNPASIMMVPTHRQFYPFTVERDPNPNGRAWLREILAEKV